MLDARWPTEWRVRGFGRVTSDELAEGCYTVAVDIPPGDDGGPDFQGLLARLRLDPAEVERLRAESAALRRVAEAAKAVLDLLRDPRTRRIDAIAHLERFVADWRRILGREIEERER